jgi:hypothetical protein
LVSGRESRNAFLLSLLAIGGASFLVSSADWMEYPTLFRNLMAGTNDYDRNVALANAAVQAGLPDALVLMLRATSITIGIGGLIASVVVARRPGGMPTAALAGTVAMLALPATLWDHYVVALLPFAAMAWPRAGTVARLALLVAAALLAVGSVGALYAAVHVGGTSLVVVAGGVLWPRSSLSPATPPAPPRPARRAP